MSPRKLSDADKREIINLYRQLPETTSTLASRYGVSSSTISRLLKNSLLEEEYEALIQQKRTKSTPMGEMDGLELLEALKYQLSDDSQITQTSQATLDFGKDELSDDSPMSTPPAKATLDFGKDELSDDSPMSTPPTKAALDFGEDELSDDSPMSTPASRRLRRRSRATSQPEALSTEAQELPDQYLEIPQTSKASQTSEEITAEFIDDEDERNGPDEAEVNALEEMLGEDLSDLEDEDEDDDADNDDDDDDADNDDDWDDETPLSTRQSPFESFLSSRNGNVQVLPLSEASLPKTCYLVVDRSAELIARPLKDFSDLGRIPVAEVQQKTLPVFDNHRVARRFSNRAQRVIKIPDGRMLQKTRYHLQAKGITRLLIDGQVYSLS